MLAPSAIMTTLRNLIAAVNSIANTHSMQQVVGSNIASPSAYPTATSGDSRIFYVDGRYAGYEDDFHFSTPLQAMTALGNLTTVPSATKPVRVISGLKTNGGLLDWSGYTASTVIPGINI
ncbi:MAG: hypothetical protein WBW71_09560, partial [Bacteroidota bacterium]